MIVDAPHAVEEEDEAVSVALRARVGKFYSFLLFSFFIYRIVFLFKFLAQCPLGDNAEQMEQYLQEIRETIGKFL